MLKKFFLLLRTIRYLKIIQFRYQILYRFRKKTKKQLIKKKPNTAPIKWKPIIHSHISNYNNSFCFLNIQHQFIDRINWNYAEYGKLWTYNLNYFDFLLQNDIIKEKGFHLVNDFINNHDFLKEGLDSYPISLRGMNWIKFLSIHNIKEEKIDRVLYSDYIRLVKNLEYHLLGNHLLENGFSLLFGAYYFRDKIFYTKARSILKNELDEQILSDGAHFELSPMYHQILLKRLLDSIQLLQLNDWQSKELLPLLKGKAKLMLSWLQQVTYKNGNVPMVNDATYDIAPTSPELFIYAQYLGISFNLLPLSDSGYRKLQAKNYELFIDVGNIGPDYQPGHAHSDTFNFELHINGNPVIVDTGTSTYEKNDRRQIERSTASHNTIEINQKNQSEVWGGFRVARRARIINLEEAESFIKATHNGYMREGYKHTRKFSFEQKQVVLLDTISKHTNNKARAFFHLHSSLPKPVIKGNLVSLEEQRIEFSFSANQKIEIEEYNLSEGFNKMKKAYKIIVTFDNLLRSKISL